MMRVLSSIVVLAVCCTSCSLLRPSNVFDDLPMLSPDTLGQQVQLSQKVKMSRLFLRHKKGGSSIARQNAEPLVLVGAWSVTKESLSFVGLTATGQTLLKLHYQNGVMTEEYSPVLTETVLGRDVLVQLQLAYWPVESIRQQLRGTDWHLETSGETRTVYVGRRKVLMIESAPSVSLPAAVVIINYAHQYQLSIETISQAVLP